MKKKWMLTVSILGLLAFAQGVRAESAHRFGVGANYWQMMHDIDADHFDRNGLSWLASYQFKPAALIKLEADLEVFPKRFQGIDGVAYAPEAYLVVGSTIYGAAGVGILYADGEFGGDPFYALRAGLDLEIVPRLSLDLNVNYRFAKWSKLSDLVEAVDADTLTLGAAVRVEI